ncbi:MAG: N-acetylmuramoyl-L-alanine amidase [Candidatus Aquirickettsiella sp.]
MTNYTKKLIIDQTYPSPNHTERHADILFLVLHYTVGNLKSSLTTLTTPSTNVSSHYLIPDSPIDNQSKVYQLVQEDQRAWHSGLSHWKNNINLNDTSIGIEMVNLGYKNDEKGNKIWYPFTDYQINCIIELTKDIVKRYQILPTCVVGHSDIAPNRKLDPGPLFPWKILYENGVGAWFDEAEVSISKNCKLPIDIKQLQTNLKTFGYNIIVTAKIDDQTRNVLKAFQMHFRPSDYSGKPDAETVAILNSLIKKYFN